MLQDPNARLFILQPSNPDGSRQASPYSLKSHPQFGSAASYFDSVRGWGPCFGTALHPDANGYGLTFLSPPVIGWANDVHLKANRHLTLSFGLDGLAELTSYMPAKYNLFRTSPLRIYAAEKLPDGSLEAPTLGTAPAGVSFDRGEPCCMLGRPPVAAFRKCCKRP
jgi:hypothetical protein